MCYAKFYEVQQLGAPQAGQLGGVEGWQTGPGVVEVEIDLRRTADVVAVGSIQGEEVEEVGHIWVWQCKWP